MFCHATTHSFPAEIFDASPLSDDDQRISLEQIELLYLCPRWATCCPASTLWRLQRVLHASARLVLGAGRHEHVTPLLHELHWLPIQKRIDMRLGTLAYLCRTGRAPTYLSDELVEVTSLPGRRHLRSAIAGLLTASRRARYATLGGRAFGAVSSQVWNRLPHSVTSATSVCDFNKRLKKILLD